VLSYELPALTAQIHPEGVQEYVATHSPVSASQQRTSPSLPPV
jgi:hypothetical protein